MEAMTTDEWGAQGAIGLPDFFWGKVRKGDPGECWEWQAGKDGDGYGKFSFAPLKAVTERAHRLVLISVYGFFDKSLVVDHLCRNPSCVNPEHLEAVSNVENLARGKGFGALNSAKTHCPEGHEYDSVNHIGRRACRECSNARYARFRARHRERLLKKKREYRESNRDAINARRRELRQIKKMENAR